jgi:hypothetical protein
MSQLLGSVVGDNDAGKATAFRWQVHLNLSVVVGVARRRQGWQPGEPAQEVSAKSCGVPANAGFSGLAPGFAYCLAVAWCW